ncbi:MAG: MATE family efflux transporter [Bacteroidales bacterium]|nr:MATE family efflux transporter [Bacteroidales bacterium]
MNDFTTGRIGRPLISFAIPIILGNFFMQTYNIVNSAVVGSYLGKEALAAVGAAYPVIFLLMSLVIGISSGGTVLVSHYMGARDSANLRKSIDTTYFFILVSGLFITVLGILLTPTIYRIINLPTDVFPGAVAYLRVYLISTVFSFAFNGTSALLRGMGDSRTPLFFLIGSNILNLALSLFFICVMHWGLVSSAWASVISQVCACSSLLIYLRAKHSHAAIRFRGWKWSADIFTKMIKIGLPTGVQQSVVSLGQMALLSIVNGFGTVMVAAYSSMMRIDAIAIMPGMNFSQALSTFTGQNIGAGKMDRVNKAFRFTIKTNIMISLVISLIFILFGKDIMSLFTSDHEVIAEGYRYLLVCGPFYFLFSAMFSFTGLFRGAGDTVPTMLISLLSLWLFRIPTAYFFSHLWGSIGVWISIPVGWLFGFVFSIIYYRYGKWRNKKIATSPVEIVNHPAAQPDI